MESSEFKPGLDIGIKQEVRDVLRSNATSGSDLSQITHTVTSHTGSHFSRIMDADDSVYTSRDETGDFRRHLVEDVSSYYKHYNMYQSHRDILQASLTGTVPATGLNYSDDNWDPSSMSQSYQDLAMSQSECPVCNKVFANLKSLNTHLRIHSGVRPYVCTECNKTFSRSDHLTSHMSIHTGERPHNCTVCNRSFSKKENLKVHMRTHTGERPHQCLICGKRYGHSGTLKMHMKVHF